MKTANRENIPFTYKMILIEKRKIIHEHFDELENPQE